MKKKKLTGAVAWILPGKKRPFVYSTKAANDLIVLLAQEHETVRQIQDAINYDYEAKMIMQGFIDNGFGGLRLRDYID